MDNKKRINQIWEDNPKIPFMQSKDIFALGYKYGYNDKDNTISGKKINKESTINNDGFTGTTKELIETTNKILGNLNTLKNVENNKNEKILKGALSEKETYEILIKCTADILKYMNLSKNFWEIYDYITDLNRKYQDKLYYMKHNI